MRKGDLCGAALFVGLGCGVGLGARGYHAREASWLQRRR